jgi:hypothetical protein
VNVALAKGVADRSVYQKAFFEALTGNVASADQILNMRVHAEKHGDTGLIVIRITGGIPSDT